MSFLKMIFLKIKLRKKSDAHVHLLVQIIDGLEQGAFHFIIDSIFGNVHVFSLKRFRVAFVIYFLIYKRWM